MVMGSRFDTSSRRPSDDSGCLRVVGALDILAVDVLDSGGCKVVESRNS